MSDFVKYLPVGNGDSILIKADSHTILTDVKFRAPSDDVYDISKDIQKSCENQHLNYFISTHQDQDHVLGFSELFHCGAPNAWSKSDGKILVDEIICSSRALTEEPTEASQAILDEIQRRYGLKGLDKDKDGNRLRIVGEGELIEVGTKIKGKVLAPNADEVDGESRNNSSVVIRWEYQDTTNAAVTKILLGGDAECDVWARLHDDYEHQDLEWHLCTAPHHCSMTPFAAKENVQDKDADYVDNEKAINALSHSLGHAFVVSSSKQIKRNDDNPPHYKAKLRWVKILKTSDTDDKSDERFFCTSTHDNGNEAPVIFILDSRGIKMSKKSPGDSVKSAALSSTTKYGC